MSSRDVLEIVLIFGLLGFLFWRNLPGAVAFVRPGAIRYRVEGGPAAAHATRSPATREMIAALEDLGFTPLGTAVEKRPLRPGRHEIVLANPEERAFAVVAPVGSEAWLHYFTAFEDGGAVITADYHWPSVEEPGYLAGGLPGAGPQEILNTHRRRVQRLVEEGRAVDDRYTLEARAETAEAFYARGPGRREVRRREIKGMMFTTAALIVVLLTAIDAARR
mgnify:CR=1 FL=1